MRQTVLITGGSRGIGNAAAKLFGENGYNVAVNYRKSEEEAKRLVSELTKAGCDAVCIAANVADRAEVDAMTAQVFSRFGPIDVLVNNAGIAQQKMFTDLTQQDWSDMMDVDIGGMFNCCQSVLPDMIHRKSGKIINVSSVWGQTGASCEVHYSTAKAAVIGFTKALAKELGPSGITVNCVAPGVIDTQMNKMLTETDRKTLCEETPLMRIGTARDVAETILFLASDKADFYTGQVLCPNGGFLI